MAATESSTGITVERQGAAAVLVLDRPAERNAVSSAMRKAWLTALSKLGRDPMVYGAIVKSRVAGVFSVGRDVGELQAAIAAGEDRAVALLSEEIAFFWAQECFFRPVVAFIDGTVEGSGIGCALFATHRVAGDDFRLRLLPPGHDSIPTGGVIFALARMPKGIGRYFALTNHEIGPAAAHAHGLVTHCIPSRRFVEIEAGLADADPVDPLLDARHVDPAKGVLQPETERIARYFEEGAVEDVKARLANPAAADASWAEDALARMEARSPLMLALTDEALRRAASYDDVREALIDEHRILRRLLSATPSPADPLPAAAVVGTYFIRDRGDLSLPSRDDAQAGSKP